MESTARVLGGAKQSASSTGVSVFLEGQPFWSDRDGTPATARSILDHYLQSGHSYLSRLNGAFAIALFDDRSNELTLAIDRMGIDALAWCADGDHVFFSSSAALLAHRPSGRTRIREQAVYEFFFFHMVPAPDSIFPGITKLLPGTAVTFGRSGTRTWAYWTPDFGRHSHDRFTDLKNDLYTALRAAVRTQYSGPTTGAFLSGGLDSSTVTGLLSEVSQEPAHTFSIGFGVEGYSELEYSRITNAHFNCAPHEYEVTPRDIVETIPTVANRFDEPFGNASAIPTYACARYAKDLGMARLLAGDGGDELFAGNLRYSRQKVFEVFNRVPKFVRDSARTTVSRLIKPNHPLGYLRKLRSYVDQASIPLPERLETWNFVYREGAKTVFHDDFIGAIDMDGPFRHMKEIYESTSSTDLLDRMLCYDWKFTLADSDLRKVTTMCNAADIEVAFPMLDNRVVEMSVEVPSAQKMNGLALRSFYKKAMRGFLPDAILKKKKHGFGLPFGQWLKTDRTLADLVYGHLSDLKHRTIIKAQFLDQLIKEHRDGHAAYYGEFIWDLVILEEWFKHQAQKADTIERRSLQGA